MKWKKNNQTSNEGVLYVQDVVNRHGSIFRAVPQETDVGIDGFIELVHDEKATGQLIAVQIKSGESYVAKDSFVVNVDQRHLDYWSAYLLPVIIICYSPVKQSASYVSVNNYIENEIYHERLPIKRIKIPFSDYCNFGAASLSEGRLGQLTKVVIDSRTLMKCADLCLTGSESEKISALQVLCHHPFSSDNKLTTYLARKLLCDKSILVAKFAIQAIGYRVARDRWSWSPCNKEERDIIEFASTLCADLSVDECNRLLELVDDEDFHGPEALGERVVDILHCNPRYDQIVTDVASNKALPIQRRINALYIWYGCDENELLERPELADDVHFGDVYRKILSLLEGNQ